MKALHRHKYGGTAVGVWRGTVVGVWRGTVVGVAWHCCWCVACPVVMPQLWLQLGGNTEE